MSVPRLKLRFRLKFFFLELKRKLWCRWFKKSHRRCHPEVWVGGDITKWHCSDCVPCDSGLDLALNPKNWVGEAKEF